MSNDRNRGADDPLDRELLRRYQEASNEVGERPSAAARAAILAFAARGVDAKPVDAAAGVRTRSRLPLAAAAAVLLSTLAVMLAIRTSEEMPQFSAPSEAVRTPAETQRAPADKLAATASDGTAAPMAQSPATSAVTSPAPPSADRPPAAAAPSAEAARAQESAGQVQNRRQKIEKAAAESQPAQARSEAAVPAAKTAPSTAASSAREEDRAAASEAPARGRASEIEQRQNAPAAAPPPPEQAAAGAKLRKELPEPVAVPPAAPKDQASADGRRDAAKPATQPSLGALQSERRQVEEPAAVWLERIIKLRREGRHDEADAELKRFRERYPQVQPPLEALPATGTR